MKNANEGRPACDVAFLEMLAAHNAGNEVGEASATLRQILAAVQLTGKRGQVSMTLDIIPASQNQRNRVDLIVEVKSKIPKLKPPGQIFYVDDDFNLMRDDPMQTKLPLRIAGEQEPAVPFKKVNQKSGKSKIKKI